jgi:NAD(P)-dependent dehydrogenase (short-subunit alcohol dehydrogenase family)
MRTLKELSNLRGRCAFISGATGHLGRVMADTLAELGCDLFLTDHPGVEKALEELSNRLQSDRQVGVTFGVCNLEEQFERALLIEKFFNKNHSLNILINNAAFVGTQSVAGWSEPLESQSIEVWRRAMEVNLTAVFELCQGLSPIMNVSDGAAILNIASIYGMYGPDWRIYEGLSMGSPAAYAASKGGLIQLTRWLATTLSPKIRVNAIAPGGLERGQPEEFIRKYENRTPLGRMATEEDFKGVVAFLSSDLSSYVTGQVINVDGGWGAW